MVPLACFEEQKVTYTLRLMRYSEFQTPDSVANENIVIGRSWEESVMQNEN